MQTTTKHVKEGQTFKITYSTGEFKGGTATFKMEAKRQARTFDTRAEANAFMLGLSENPNCEGYRIEREK